MEDRDMGTEVIPAGERGSFRLTKQILIDSDATTLAAVQVLLEEEAKARGLLVLLEDDRASGEVIVHWRPEGT